MDKVQQTSLKALYQLQSKRYDLQSSHESSYALIVENNLWNAKIKESFWFWDWQKKPGKCEREAKMIKEKRKSLHRYQSENINEPVSGRKAVKSKRQMVCQIPKLE